MKKIFKALLAVVFLGIILVCVFFIFREPLTRLFNKATKITLNVETYIMDPDTSLYNKETEEVYLKKGEGYEIKPKEVEYHEVNLEKSILSITDIQEESTICIYYDSLKTTITIDPNGGKINDSTSDYTYTVNLGSHFKAPEALKTGYYVKGYEGYSEIVTTSLNLKIIWEVQQFKVTFVLPSGAYINDSNYIPVEGTSNYYRMITYFDTLFMPTVESSIYTFQHFVDEDGNTVYIKNNILSDITLIGKFNEKMYTISFVYDGYSFDPVISGANHDINPPKLPADLKTPGSDINWYTDETYETLYDFYLMGTSDITLYGKLEEDTGCGFLDYDISKSTIDSLDDLVCCMDYVYYNYLDEAHALEKEITYCKENQVNSEFQKASDLAEYRSNTTLTLSVTTSTLGLNTKIFVKLFSAEDTSNYEGTITMTPNDKEVYPYLDYVSTSNLRSSDYDNFYINSLSCSYDCKTTNQLLYVVEHGYKPNVITGSRADSIYQKAKEVLRNIVSDDMTDYEKVEAIYRYLVMNIQYDHNVLADGKPYPWQYYDSYFMEGVFNHQKAVCDGIAKSLVLLCNIEGIPCVEVSGNHHAWCEVKVKNRWYVIDATMGNLGIDGTNYTVMDYSEFLTSKATKVSKGYDSKEFSNIKCLQDFPYFEYTTFTYKSKDYDLYIETADELATLLQYVETKDYTTISFNIFIAKELTSTYTFNDFFNDAKDRYQVKALKVFNRSVSWLPASITTGTVVKIVVSK